MPSDPTEQPFYVSVEPFLQQGDIFEAPVVTPFASTVARIFRAADGRHGSVVFTEQSPGKVFSQRELEMKLQGITQRSPLHTSVFEITPDGHPELVIASAQLAEFFIVASQTCDICGVDKAPKDFAVILRAMPLRSLCMAERLPLDGEGQPPISIHNYLLRETKSKELENSDQQTYRTALRAALTAWGVKQDKKAKLANTIKSLLDGGPNLFYLQDDPTFGLVEMSVDLTTLHTVPTRLLAGMLDRRKASLETSYRNKFAQDFGNRFARVAVPQPMAAAKII